MTALVSAAVNPSFIAPASDICGFIGLPRTAAYKPQTNRQHVAHNPSNWQKQENN